MRLPLGSIVALAGLATAAATAGLFLPHVIPLASADDSSPAGVSATSGDGDRAGDLADPLASAFEAYEAGEVEQAQLLYLHAAGTGSTVAGYNAAVIRLSGEAGMPSEREALTLLQNSAEAGFALAQHMLGTLYERGEFLPMSQALALQWWLRAANQGDADAQLAVATQYFLGRGTRIDLPEAAHWYRRAADAGDAGAQYILASMYEKGNGLTTDLDQALTWYSAAARQGDIVAGLKAQEIVERLTRERRN